MKRFLIIAAMLVPLGACSIFGKPETPAQIVFSAHVGYNAALSAVEVYADLPYCSETQPQPCRTEQASDAVLAAEAAAKATLDAAQEVVTTENLSDLIKQESAERALDVVATFRALLIEVGVINIEEG
jgi:hypothetical protein